MLLQYALAMVGTKHFTSTRTLKYFACLFTAFSVTPVTIGLQETQYSVPDTADYKFVCAEVQSGSIDGRDIDIVYSVRDDGTYLPCRSQQSTLSFLSAYFLN